jgi:hypothetical protein
MVTCLGVFVLHDAEALPALSAGYKRVGYKLSAVLQTHDTSAEFANPGSLQFKRQI